MPYKDISGLPDPVQAHLPIQAQKIYMESFNSAFSQYKDPSKRKDGSSVEEVAHRVAWSAVKKVYYKNKKGKWVKKP